MSFSVVFARRFFVICIGLSFLFLSRLERNSGDAKDETAFELGDSDTLGYLVFAGETCVAKHSGGQRTFSLHILPLSFPVPVCCAQCAADKK